MQISLDLEGFDNRLLNLRLCGLGQRHSGIRHIGLRSRQLRSCFHQVPEKQLLDMLTIMFMERTANENRFAVLISYAVFDACTIIRFPINGALVKSI